MRNGRASAGRRAGIVCLFALTAALAAAAGEPRGVRLRSRTLEASPTRELAVRPLLAVPRAVVRHLVLQLDHTPTVEERLLLGDAGIRLVQNLDGDGWFASVRGPVSPGTAGLELVRGSWTIEPEDRLSPRLLDRTDRPPDAAGTLLGLTVLAFDDVDIAALALEIEALGARVRSTQESLQLIFVDAPKSAWSSSRASTGCTGSNRPPHRPPPKRIGRAPSCTWTRCSPRRTA